VHQQALRIDPLRELHRRGLVDVDDAPSAPPCGECSPEAIGAAIPDEAHILFPNDAINKFQTFAEENMTNNVESLGILLGKRSFSQEAGRDIWIVEALFLPRQTGTDTTCQCAANHDASVLVALCESHSWTQIGWLHTHPRFESFLSSVDQHCQAAHQSTLPEYIAGVMDKRNCMKYFQLTALGLEYASACTSPDHFHEHPGGMFQTVQVGTTAAHRVIVLDEEAQSGQPRTVTCTCFLSALVALRPVAAEAAHSDLACLMGLASVPALPGLDSRQRATQVSGKKFIGNPFCKCSSHAESAVGPARRLEDDHSPSVEEAPARKRRRGLGGAADNGVMRAKLLLMADTTDSARAAKQKASRSHRKAAGDAEERSRGKRRAHSIFEKLQVVNHVLALKASGTHTEAAVILKAASLGIKLCQGMAGRWAKASNQHGWAQIPVRYQKKWREVPNWAKVINKSDQPKKGNRWGTTIPADLEELFDRLMVSRTSGLSQTTRVHEPLQGHNFVNSMKGILKKYNVQVQRLLALSIICCCYSAHGTI